MFNFGEILETLKMIQEENLDIRTITLGVSLLDCVDSSIAKTCENIKQKIREKGQYLVETAKKLEIKYGIPIVNARVAVTPISLLAGGFTETETVKIGYALEEIAQEIGVNFIGGFSALVHKGFTKGDINVLNTIPRVLAETERVCASINVATTRAGINMDGINFSARIIKETAERTRDKDGLGCAKIVVFANAPEDNPFMAGAFHGVGEADYVVNVGVSGPGVVKRVVEKIPGADLEELANEIKKTAFKITRVGELIGKEAAKMLGVKFGIVDLSLAPTPAMGDSVAEIIEAMGLEYCGAPGTTAALMMLTDAVKKGGAMASSMVGGLSGAFIPVSEDMGMVRAVEVGALNIEKLEAMTAVCSVGLDMIAIPGETPVSTIAGIIADEISIGVINGKTTAVRIIPVPGKKAGEYVEFGGLLGRTVIMDVNRFSSEKFVMRGGRIPAPIQSLRN
ncbi:PFL family protein [Carboxydothermus ferrireducens]|uniref:UPF0210 protein HDG70_002031 n=1 Tax=Carboxydothermus ferrireducens DSM 11255 TaxID=1119529 RepID=A0ABX2RBF9_9THEO|nr:PFL family protein [Carboxydothermus ferrireducens]NYE58280.1 hypothetical protein [Carboxydothermus ferrireducens DSM 11255]